MDNRNYKSTATNYHHPMKNKKETTTKYGEKEKKTKYKFKFKNGCDGALLVQLKTIVAVMLVNLSKRFIAH